MFGRLFLQILNMSFTAGIVIVFLLFVRLLLRNAPRIFSYALWSVALFRLVCPFSFESRLSLLDARAIPDNLVNLQPSRINGWMVVLHDNVNAPLPVATSAAGMRLPTIGMLLWLCGIAVLVIYSVVSLVLLRRRLRGATRVDGNIYHADGLASPFVMGLLRPRIYLPANLSAAERQFILLHEQTHIRRLDHLVKLVSFAVLCVHWFNPLVWVAFFLCGKDMEMSCDEAVIKRLGAAVKQDYSTSLLTLATGRRIVGGSPLAFGEGDTKSRIKHVLHYKKPALWLLIAAVVVVVIVGVGLAANPQKPPPVTNFIYTSKLTEAQESDITMRYQLNAGDNLFETKFQVSENIKSYTYYVELYQHGKLLGTYASRYGNLREKDGSIFTAYSMNRGADRRWESMRWLTSFAEGDLATFPSIPFPDGFVPQGVSTSTLTNEGPPDEMTPIVPEQPIILASIAMNSAERSEIRAYNCDYLMENPEAIAQYECVYLVKCVFSTQSGSGVAEGL